jgi:hypothetical protein
MTPCPDLVLDPPKSRPEASYLRPSAPKSAPVLVQHEPATPVMNITGSHMLLALAIALCLAGPLAWAFVRYWLFAL